MKRLGYTLLLLMAFAIPMHAQDCDTTIVDGAHVVTNPVALQAQADKLMNQGAEVRIRTFQAMPAGVTNMDAVEQSLEAKCPSWSLSGIRKSTLISILLAPADHKFGIYYGAAWHHALDNNWTTIKTDSMIPAFRAKDFQAGLTLGTEALANRLVASKDQALHPAVSQTVVNEKATDFSGLWVALKWGLFILAMAGLLWWALAYFERRKEEQEAYEQAKEEAVTAKNAVASTMNDLRTKLGDAAITAKNQLAVKSLQARFDNLAAKYITYAASASGNPDTYTHAAPLNALTDAYNNMESDLDKVDSELAIIDEPDYDARKPQTVSSGHSRWKTATHRDLPSAQEMSPLTPIAARPMPSPGMIQDAVPAQSQVIHEHTTTVINNGSPSSDLMPLLVADEILSNDREDRREERLDREESYQPPTPSYESRSEESGGSSSFSNDDEEESGGGGSSSFSSDDSSSFDSGGSDSFSGGDSGGGGGDSF